MSSAGSTGASATTPRYETILRLASGGMATVWIGTVRGALGFRQLVAIKKPHPHLLSDPGFRGELIAEARLASMIRHANVVDVRDVEIDGDSISLVMDFIEGASLGELLVASGKREAPSQRIPARVAVRIVRDACAGLHAAHDLVDERDRPVGLVHRDVSPQNVLVGTDGISRVTDFGVAKFARKNMQSTSEGSLKGKLAYMAPEYVRGEEIDRRFDVFATGVVLWEALTGKRCFRGENEAETLRRLLDWVPEPVSIASGSPELEPLDSVVSCALMKNRDDRFQNAAAMGAALESAASASGLMGSHTEVAATLKDLAGASIEERRALVRAKLAKEPSVASLMGHPPIEALQRDLPPTVGYNNNNNNNNKPAGNATLKDPSAPPMPTATNPATPKMGGAADEPSTVGVTITTHAAHGAASAIPSTQPMTPPLGGSAMAAVGVVATLPSAPPLKARGGGGGPGPDTPHTLASAAVTPQQPQSAPGNHTLRSEDAAAPAAPAAPISAPAMAPMTTTTAYASNPSELAAAFPVSAPPRRSLVPFFVGVVVVVGAVIALVVVARTRSDATTTTTTTQTTTAATAASSSAAPQATTSSSAPHVADVAPTVSATPSASTRAISTTLRATGTTRAKPPPSAAAPISTSTTKKPPDNPYND